MLVPLRLKYGRLVVSTVPGSSAYGPAIGSTYGQAPIANGVGSSMRSASKQYSVMQMSSGTTLRDIADALNAIGVTPRDLIAIVQALKRGLVSLDEMQ